MISRAKLSYLRIAPRKVRLVADLIRGVKAEEAQAILRYARKKAVPPILKLLNQALANAKNKGELKAEELYISEIYVNGGPAYKRTFPRARGKADTILKRTSHITLILDNIKKEKRKEKRKDRKGKRKNDSINKSEEAAKKTTAKKTSVSRTKPVKKLKAVNKKISAKKDKKKEK